MSTAVNDMAPGTNPAQPDPKPQRGSFPKGPPGETVEQRRERYELWVLSTHSRQPDYEARSIAFYRGRTKLVPTGLGSSEKKEVPATPSRRLCVTSRCWQCEAGDDEPNAHLRIADCRVTRCGLFPVRPYQQYADAASDSATPEAEAEEDGSREVGDYKAAIRKACLDCVGNYAEVRRCTAVTCALYPARPAAQGGPQQTEAADA